MFCLLTKKEVRRSIKSQNTTKLLYVFYRSLICQNEGKRINKLVSSDDKTRSYTSKDNKWKAENFWTVFQVYEYKYNTHKTISYNKYSKDNEEVDRKPGQTLSIDSEKNFTLFSLECSRIYLLFVCRMPERRKNLSLLCRPARKNKQLFTVFIRNKLFITIAGSQQQQKKKKIL